MYRPAHFDEPRLDVLHALMRAHPLALLITGDEGRLVANHVPFVLVDDGDRGTLRAHIAKANDQVEPLRAGGEALVVFQGPQSYVSPSWYPSKAVHGKVVPTWNYVVVQAKGRSRVIDDAAWVHAQIELLTASQEGRRPKPWHVDDAPSDFVAAQMRAIIGIEIPIATLEGKWKVSQNRPEADRRGVEAALRDERHDDDMAALVADRGRGGT